MQLKSIRLATIAQFTSLMFALGCQVSSADAANTEAANNTAPALSTFSVAQQQWFTSWSTAHTEAAAALSNQSLRMVMQLSVGGDKIRVQLRNKFGTTPVTVNAASIGLVQAGAALRSGTSRPLSFAGRPSVVVDVGQDLWSDPVSLVTQAQQVLAVSFFVSGAAIPSQDSQAYMTSYMSFAGAGNHIGEDGDMAFSAATQAMVLIGSIDVLSDTLSGAIIGVGGSTTDGIGSDGKIGNLIVSPSTLLFPQPACNPCRWTDFLARRIVAELPVNEQKAVGNEGVAGDTTVNILNRYDSDVLAHAGLSHLILSSGANDLGVLTGDSATTIIANIKSAIDRAHAAGAKIIVATINPRISYTPIQNQYRRTVNVWVRAKRSCGGACDGIVDFDAALAWPLYPNAIDPRYDSGDTIHPNPAGYKRMADSIDLRLFAN